MAEIKEFATKARKVVKEFADKSNLFTPHLGGLCGISSFLLKKISDEKNINSTVICGHYNGLDGHLWLKVHLDNDYIVDITETQFQNPNSTTYSPVSIYESPHNRYWENELKVEYNIFSHWPEDRRPTPLIVEELYKEYLKELVA